MSKEVEDQVLNIRKQLEKEENGGNLLDLLKALSELKVSLQIVTTTQIGMTVSELRNSSSDEEVLTLANSLIKTWKKFVPDSAEMTLEEMTSDEIKQPIKDGNDADKLTREEGTNTDLLKCGKCNKRNV